MLRDILSWDIEFEIFRNSFGLQRDQNQKKIDLNLMKYQSDVLIDLKGDVTQTIRNDDF